MGLTNAAVVFPGIAMGFSTSLPGSDLQYSFGYYNDKAVPTKCSVGSHAKSLRMASDIKAMADCCWELVTRNCF